MDYDEFRDFLADLQSIRKYEDSPVSDETINKILDAARLAPSAANIQPWEFLVVRDPDVREELFEILKDAQIESHELEHVRDPSMRFWGEDSRIKDPESYQIPYQSPVHILILGDKRVSKAYPWRIERNSEVQQSHTDSSLANVTIYLRLAARALGLGSKYNSSFRLSAVEGRVKQLLDIPDDLFLYELISIGYYDYDPTPSARQDLDELTHWERYNHDLHRTTEEVHEFVKTKPRTNKRKQR